MPLASQAHGYAARKVSDATGVLHGLRAAGDEPARDDRDGAGGREARLRLRLGRRGVGHRLRDRPLLARRDDREDQARLGDHADPRPDAVEHGDDRRDARPALGRPLPPRPRDIRTAGRRGLARRAVGQAAREDAGVRRDRAHGAAPRDRRAPRRALRHPALERNRPRQAPEADGASAARGHPDLPRGHGPEGGRAGVRDRRRLAPDLLVAGEGAKRVRRRGRRRPGRLRHRRDRAGDPHRRRRRRAASS